jgi:hypothetical protein
MYFLAVFLSSWLPHAFSINYVPQDGDLVFQTSQSRQSKVIQAVTGSPYSHMGVIFLKNGAPVVCEAVGPVKYTLLSDWIKKGLDQHYVVKRLDAPKLTAEQVKALRAAATAYEGKDYDFLFSWSDQEIYCSELVWKMFKSALGLEVGKMQRFGDFNLSSPQARTIVRERWGSKPPLNEPVITPASIFASPLLKTVYGG